jgi:predicted RNase H-like nuclease (RuvC/YqgF family)
MSIAIETDLKEILDKLDQKMDRQFAQLDQKMDRQFAQLDQKIERLDQKMDRQFEQIDQKIERLDQKIERTQEDINKLQVGQARIEGDIKALDNKGSVIQPIITGITVAFVGGGLLALYKYLP